jgi:hypothetical protein
MTVVKGVMVVIPKMEIMRLRKGLQNEESNRRVLHEIMCDRAKT